MFKFILPVLLILTIQHINAQEELPYSEVPDYPAEYTAGTVAARMVDGLGFRFYWATDSLRKEDLAYKASDEARTTGQTIEHIYQMSFLILNTVSDSASYPSEELTLENMRSTTLNNLKQVRERLLTSSAKEMESYKLVFSNGYELPFWNLVNGPIADALWHCGQIVANRRASGNPFNSNVSLLNGRKRN